MGLVGRFGEVVQSQPDQFYVSRRLFHPVTLRSVRYACVGGARIGALVNRLGIKKKFSQEGI